MSSLYLLVYMPARKIEGTHIVKFLFHFFHIKNQSFYFYNIYSFLEFKGTREIVYFK